MFSSSSALIATTLSCSQNEPLSVLPRHLLNEYRHLTQTETLSAITLETIQQLLEKHCQIFAFSTLAANLSDETITPEATSLARYLLENKSGLCFHHNNTVCEVLKDMGFTAELIACQFKRPKTDALYPIPTHAAILVNLSGSQYLIDPGLGFGITAIIPLYAEKFDDNSYYVEQVSPSHFKLHKPNAGQQSPSDYIYAFDSKPVRIESFQAGIASLKKADKLSPSGELIEQGHLFYSFFYYSKNDSQGNLIAITTSTLNNMPITHAGDQSIYNHLRSVFNEDPLKNHPTKNFANTALKSLILDAQIPKAYQRSSSASLSLRR